MNPMQKPTRERLQSKAQPSKKNRGVPKQAVSFTQLLSDFLIAKESNVSAVQFLNTYSRNTDNPKVVRWQRNNSTVSFQTEESFKLHYDYKIIVEDDQNHERLLVCKVSEFNNVLRVKQIQINNTWFPNDIKDLTVLVNYFIQAKITLTDASKVIEEKEFKISLERPLNWFDNPNELSELIKLYQNRSCGLQQFITYHTQYIDQKHVFWLSYPKKNLDNFSLEVALDFVSFKEEPTEEDYFSWVFAEDEFLKLHGQKKGQTPLKYYRLGVAEHFTDENGLPIQEKRKKIVDAWFSLDSVFGELRNIEKGNVLSGTDIMLLVDYLNLLFQIANLYLSDSSRLHAKSEIAAGQIVFRVLLSVAYGKTLYQRFNYQAFTFQKLKHGWPGEHNVLSQDQESFENAQHTLYTMPISDVEKAFKEEEKKLPPGKESASSSSAILGKLQAIYAPGDKNLTLGSLTAAVHRNCRPAQNQRNSDLHKMYGLLTLPRQLDDKDIPNKHRFYQCLYSVVYTSFFVKRLNDRLPDKTEFQLKTPKVS